MIQTGKVRHMFHSTKVIQAPPKSFFSVQQKGLCEVRFIEKNAQSLLSMAHNLSVINYLNHDSIEQYYSFL